MAIAKAHPPNASALRRVVGPDRKITRDTTHLATGRWPDGPPQPGLIGPSDQAGGVAKWQ
jgi:hypothetical protein